MPASHVIRNESHYGLVDLSEYARMHPNPADQTGAQLKEEGQASLVATCRSLSGEQASGPEWRKSTKAFGSAHACRSYYQGGPKAFKFCNFKCPFGGNSTGCVL
jgi:hypothetical protein